MARTRTPHKTLIDPLFSIPPGAEDEFARSREIREDEPLVVIDDIEYGADDYDAEEFGEEFEIVETTDDEDFTTPVELDTPDTFTIIDQIIRRAPGGQITVDVIIQIEDIEGARDYEIRVTKV